MRSPRFRLEWSAVRSKVVPDSSSTACSSEQAGPQLELDRRRPRARWSAVRSKVVPARTTYVRAEDSLRRAVGALRRAAGAVDRVAVGGGASAGGRRGTCNVVCSSWAANVPRRSEEKRAARCRQAEAKCAWRTTQCRSPALRDTPPQRKGLRGTRCRLAAGTRRPTSFASSEVQTRRGAARPARHPLQITRWAGFPRPRLPRGPSRGTA